MSEEQQKLKDLSDKIKASDEPEKPADAMGKNYGKASSMAVRIIIDFCVPLFAGLWIGNWLDEHFGKSPLFIIIFALIGFGAGLMNIIRLANKQQDSMQQDEPEMKRKE